MSLQLLPLKVCVGPSTLSQRGAPLFPALKHTGMTHVCGDDSRPSLAAMNRCCVTVILPVPPLHDVLTDSTGAPGSSTKLFMTRSSGLPVARVISAQKSSPAALPSAYFRRY